MQPHLLAIPMRLMGAVLLLLGTASAGSAQEPPSVILRGGLTLSPQVSGVVEGDVRVWRALSLVGFVRGVRTGLSCIGATSRVPCTPDGFSTGSGVRATKDLSGWSFFAEAGAGSHAYSWDSWYPVLETSVGIGWPLGSRGVLEVGGNIKRMGASRFSTLQENYGVVPGGAHHLVGGVTAKIGLRIR
jgi:hypothetical protein